MTFDTVYDGPTEWFSSELPGGGSVRLLRPARPDVLLDDPSVATLNQRFDYMPYWGYLWPGAFLLADQLGRRTWSPGLRALELGCGLGLAGLAALALGLDVHFTDYDEAPLRFVRASAEANGFDVERYRTLTLDWNDPTPLEPFPLILGADVLYEHRLVPLVVDVVSKLLHRGGAALLAGPQRSPTEALPELARARGLDCRAQSVEALGERAQTMRGWLHVLTWPGRAADSPATALLSSLDSI